MYPQGYFCLNRSLSFNAIAVLPEDVFSHLVELRELWVILAFLKYWQIHAFNSFQYYFLL